MDSENGGSLMVLSDGFFLEADNNGCHQWLMENMVVPIYVKGGFLEKEGCGSLGDEEHNRSTRNRVKWINRWYCYYIEHTFHCTVSVNRLNYINLMGPFHEDGSALSDLPWQHHISAWIIDHFYSGFEDFTITVAFITLIHWYKHVLK